jgi:hypothetical protein
MPVPRAPGEVAQLVEHTTENRGVAGSNPALATALIAKRGARSMMSRSTRSAAPSTVDSGLPAFCRSLTFSCCVVAGGLALALAGLPSSLAHGRTGSSKTVIACFHEKSRRFTAESHPDRCHIRGYREERGKHFAGVSVRAMKWGHWGARRTRAAYGVDVHDGTRFRIIAFRPISCDGGRTWYSRVVVLTFPDGNAFGLRLPTCVDPSPPSRRS